MDLLTVQETADALGVATVTVRRYIAAGRLPAVKVGRRIHVPKQAVRIMATPAAPRQARPRRYLTLEDSLWDLVGAAVNAPPSDAALKREYLAAAVDSQPS